MKNIKIIIKLWFLVLLSLVIIYFINLNENLNILKIQFNDDYNAISEEILGNISVLKCNTYIDFIFIVFYTMLFYLSFKIFEISAQIKINKYLFYSFLLPGFFDIIENSIFLKLLQIEDKESIFGYYHCFNQIKWSVVIVFILMTLIILLYNVAIIINKLLLYIFKD